LQNIAAVDVVIMKLQWKVMHAPYQTLLQFANITDALPDIRFVLLLRL